MNTAPADVHAIGLRQNTFVVFVMHEAARASESITLFPLLPYFRFFHLM
jgi:hypothetical protein